MLNGKGFRQWFLEVLGSKPAKGHFNKVSFMPNYVFKMHKTPLTSVNFKLSVWLSRGSTTWFIKRKFVATLHISDVFRDFT